MIDRADDVIAYMRTSSADDGHQRVYAVALNLGDTPVEVPELAGAQVLASTVAWEISVPATSVLAPHAALVVLRA
jgi:hypothetical protein